MATLWTTKNVDNRVSTMEALCGQQCKDRKI